jgi:hypothetical protein
VQGAGAGGDLAEHLRCKDVSGCTTTYATRLASVQPGSPQGQGVCAHAKLNRDYEQPTLPQVLDTQQELSRRAVAGAVAVAVAVGVGSDHLTGYSLLAVVSPRFYHMAPVYTVQGSSGAPEAVAL